MTEAQLPTILLIADLPGTERLFANLSENEALHAVDRCNKRMNRAIEAYSGLIIEHQDHRWLAHFSDADEALHGALEIRQRIADLPPAGGQHLIARVALGLATGDRSPSLALLALGKAGEILCSAQALAQLETPTPGSLVPLPAERLNSTVDQENPPFFIPGAALPGGHAAEVSPQANPSDAIVQAPVRKHHRRLCVRHQGKSLLLDEKTPLLTIGRDPENMLVIDDRKVSRHHARIECRDDGFYLSDTSTNGSFLQRAGKAEKLLRQQVIRLSGRGQLCLGSSCNDVSAAIIELEPL